MVTLASVRSILSAISDVALIYTDYDHRRAVLATCAPDGEWQLIGNRNRKNGQSANGLNQPRSWSEMPSLLPSWGTTETLLALVPILVLRFARPYDRIRRKWVGETSANILISW